MKKEKLMAVILAVVMLGSVGGFAFSFIGAGNLGGPHDPNTPTPNQPTIDSPVLHRELTNQEVSSVLQAGGIIIENYYFSDCEDCAAGNSILQDFTIKFSNFILLSQVQIDPISAGSVNSERLRMLAGTGQVIDLNRTGLSEGYLLDVFCDVARVQPAECILRQI